MHGLAQRPPVSWRSSCTKIVAAYRQLFALRPPCNYYAGYEETDVVETILRTAVDLWPLDGDEIVVESVWLFERFSAVDGDELYERYLRLFDRINGTNFADLLARIMRGRLANVA